MAVVTTLTDDKDPKVTEGVETVNYSVGGVNYEVDLGVKNREAFFKALEPFVKVSRVVEPVVTVAASRGNSDLNQRIREWAKKKGLEIAERGRISSDIVEAYTAAPANEKDPKWTPETADAAPATDK
jgi:hypothetical protein